VDDENNEQVEQSIDRSNIAPAPFVRQVAATVRERLKSRGSHVNIDVRGRLAKFWYGPDATVHFELWLHENTAQLELGLHAEGPAERNRAVYTALDKCMVEIQKELGTSIWLEEWDKGWIRLYETQRLWPLDDVRVAEVAERLCEIIDVIQPIYETIADSLGHFPSALGTRTPLR